MEVIEKEFVSYEIALQMKELGFDEPCLAWYLPEIVNKSNIASVILGSYITKWNKFGDRLSVPTFSQVFRWFREKYDLFGCIELHVCNPTHWYIRIDDIIKNDYIYHSEDDNLSFKTYEEAEQACLIKLIELCQNQI